MNSGIYICATPIGNMEDITLRVLRTLRECDLIACEDTRHTANLLKHFDIKKPLISYHKFNEASRSPELINAAREGRAVAVVSDAGLPGISDPGFTVLCAAREAGVPVTVLPGASASLCGLLLSGLPCDRFFFDGFVPDGAQGRERIGALATRRVTTVLYESPHHLESTLAALSVLGDRRVALCRELTKIYEEAVVFPASSYQEVLAEHPPRGEYVIVVEGAPETAPTGSLKEQVLALIAEGMDKKEAVKAVASRNGVNKNTVYMEMIDSQHA